MKLFLPLSLMSSALLLEEVQAFATPKASFILPTTTDLFSHPPESSNREIPPVELRKKQDLSSDSFEGSETDELDAFKNSADGDFIDVAIRADAPKMLDMVVSQLLGAMAIYTFATVRDFVRTNLNVMTWYRPELILTQRAARNPNYTAFYYLKQPVSLAAIYEFINHDGNWKNLEQCKDLNTQDESATNIRYTLGTLQNRVNADIVEFDDQFHSKSLVYGVTVNRTNKRISVIFRGSVIGGKDWFPTNLNAFYETLEPTPELDDAKLTKDIKVHSGFNNYLFSEPRGERKELKIEQIVNNIIALYKQEEYKNYALYISGHSLGGALAQLLAYHLGAGGQLKDLLPDGVPITAVSYASPQVGDDGYNEAFAELERKGILRHIRLSNQGDIVPVSPFGFGYTQTGLHLFLKENEKEMQVGHRNLKQTLLQVRSMGKMGTNHAIETYLQRLQFPANQPILATDTVESLYQKYAVREGE